MNTSSENIPTPGTSPASPPESTSRSELKQEARQQPANASSPSSGLPFGFVAAAAAGIFILSHQEQLGHEGGLIVIIGAVVLGLISARMLFR
jgi:hypothetical protein